MASAPRARPAHAPGPTFLSYTPNGRRLITAGANDSLRVFETSSDGEPTNIDDARDSNTAIVSTNDFFVTGSEDGYVCKFSLETNALDQILVRCTLPIRDLALSPDGQWLAVASDETIVRVVNTNDMDRVLYLREQQKPVKHVSFDPSGKVLAVSCSDGIIYFYNMSEDEPQLVRKVDGLIRAIDTEEAATSKAVWHPDGRAFAASSATRDVQVMSKRDWERQRSFSGGHANEITALAWSHNGALLVSAGLDEKICLWDTKTQQVIQKIDGGRGTVLAFSWHPTENLLSYTNTDGELYIHEDFVPSEHARLLQRGLQPAPFVHDPLGEISGNAAKVNGHRPKDDPGPRVARRGTPDSLDDILGPEDASDADGFIVDDDGAGYADGSVNGHGKRPAAQADSYDFPSKRRATQWQPRIHESFQPGSTPWRGSRRYLCLNLVGYIWTVDQDTHHSVTIEFYDRDFQRDVKITDPYGYDKACLSEKGALFSCAPTEKEAAMVYYRPHEHWTTERPDWRASLSKGEEVTALALSESFVVVSTSTDYVRIYTLFGTPLRVFRQKSSPTVTCASWRDYVLTVGNGAVGGDGTTKLQYTITNVKRSETCQSEDTVALPPNAQLSSVFFSDTGDPYIYDSAGVLLVLLHWRVPGQAQWVPVLDTRALKRLEAGRKDERYFPVAVAHGRFYCIILKGGDRYPYVPLPPLTDFEFDVPLGNASAGRDGDDAAQGEARRLEEQLVRSSVLQALREDLVGATHATAAQRAELAAGQLETDKVLLQLLAAACVEGEEKGMKALELVGLMRDRSGRMMEAAGKVAARFGREVLRAKIEEVAERRLVGLDEGDVVQ